MNMMNTMRVRGMYMKMEYVNYLVIKSYNLREDL